MVGTLYVVGTPIGNLADMSDRAQQTLASADIVAAEDTRRTGRLLAHFNIRAKRLVSFFEGNERERTAELLEALQDGHDVAIVTDGGMPGISDPGYRLVSGSVLNGIEVRVIPGPSAAIAALVASGLPTDRFVFEGFLSKRAGDRRRRLEALAKEPRTIVLFESPLRTPALLRELRASIGDRRVALARELTKRHEEVLHGTVSEVLDRIAGVALKGEVALVVEGSRGKESDVEGLLDEARMLVDAGMKKRDAAHTVAERRGVSANGLYRALLAEASSKRATGER